MIGARVLGSNLRYSILLIVLTVAATHSSQAHATKSSRSEPVLLELFTSEGCSSCPAADRLAIQLQSQEKSGRQIIIMSEHVDYWNYLGWQDRYSSPLFTARQRAYAQALGQNDVYTPEAVIDGKIGVVGNDSQSVNKAIEKCALSAKAELSLVLESDESNPYKQKVFVTAVCTDPPCIERGQLFVAITEDNLKSKVRSGENSGAILAHTGVVGSLHKVGGAVSLSPNKPMKFVTEVALDPQWKKSDSRVIAFLQDSVKMSVTGATQRKILQQ